MLPIAIMARVLGVSESGFNTKPGLGACNRRRRLAEARAPSISDRARPKARPACMRRSRPTVIGTNEGASPDRLLGGSGRGSRCRSGIITTRHAQTTSPRIRPRHDRNAEVAAENLKTPGPTLP